ncbi:uncharacterized protein FFB20_11403 [Fusarium fujikuroi]|uniref:Protein kinase domain-containing protein n=2 Tax=Fusarium fujikuroi TaxID=5127 RepID=S0DXS8_GIBF5|nr:uncharacterized protein FFUJ_02206 [Fusarium fujikuroi IMI 58289]KLP23060.1 uncharacterized protein LW94_11337 [Fusarium fujikuroi]QGI61430.1 hypothetical protein CEK27_005401 [Fusarium fujikuroi]QGI78616.1 hypothetical protein CEK25_005345 [Fusarium fujikuroi]QGI92328.1 hypothetical protein CEK26_005397 [Fusarium fujikuroi]CCT65273.1 uncharacterized protein FFUJ_02206 [Fusarium fujikuroi IMI 58289]
MVETQTIDDIAVYELHSGTGEGADMVFGFNGSLISVSIFPSNGSSSKETQEHKDRPLQDHFIDLIEKATACQDDGEYEELVDEVLAVILDAGRPLFHQLISSQDQQASRKSLHHYLFPPSFHFSLEAPAPASSVSLKTIDSSEACTALTVDPVFDQSIDEDLELNPDIPRFTPEDISVTEVFIHGSGTITAAVRVQGQEMFCKSRGRAGGLFGTSEARELKCLSEMLKAIPTETIKVPQLLGYIQHKDTQQILGFLRQWVPGCRLSDVVAAATAEKRQKWACQIRQSIELLHQNGLIWGDGKPSNIIIDEQDNAWLIDFGGGYTRGWIDEELAETRQGDEQALQKIIELLSGGEDMSSDP